MNRIRSEVKKKKRKKKPIGPKRVILVGTKMGGGEYIEIKLRSQNSDSRKHDKK